jgi:hypothetical protein
MSEKHNSESELLLGLEDYLRFLYQDDVADMIHDFYPDLRDNNVVGCAARLIDWTKTQIDYNQELHDFMHGASRHCRDRAMMNVILQYLSQHRSIREPIPRLMTAFRKALHTEDDVKSRQVMIALLEFVNNYYEKDKMFRGVINLVKSEIVDMQQINDAFSRGQIKSKVWLINELSALDTNFRGVVIMAGWWGQLKSFYEKRMRYGKMRIIDMDRASCEISDNLFNNSNLDNHKVKSIVADVNNLVLHKNGYEWDIENFKTGSVYKEKFMPDLVINTSAEHMTDEWFFQLKNKQLASDPVVAIQSNNLFDVPEHINCVHSINHMKKKYPMREILFEGELQLKGYKRVMVIGRLEQ